MNTLENNKLIAEFMGGYTIEGFENIVNFDETNNILSNECLNLKDLKFHSSWDWLMLVVEKIESLEINKGFIDFHIMPDAVIITNQKDETDPLVIINLSEAKGSIQKLTILFETKIQAVYEACIEFIKLYNSTTTLANGEK